MDTTLSVSNFSFCMSLIYEQNIENDIFPKYNFVLFSINLLFCLALLNLWISLIKFNKEQSCCGGCFSIESSETNETEPKIPINAEQKANI